VLEGRGECKDQGGKWRLPASGGYQLDPWRAQRLSTGFKGTNYKSLFLRHILRKLWGSRWEESMFWVQCEQSLGTICVETVRSPMMIHSERVCFGERVGSGLQLLSEGFPLPSLPIR
jgi:hypothetical protein